MLNFTTSYMKSLTVVVLLTFLTGNQGIAGEVRRLDWNEVVKTAQGQTVDWYMWGGSPAVNKYVNGFLAENLKRQYDITLRQVPVKDIAEVVSKLVVEKQAGKESGGNVDLMWINGENFRTCKSGDLLFGPFPSTLPNIKYVDRESPTVANDFGTPVDDMESPWGSAQMVMIYDSANISQPPRTIPALIEWIRGNPGRFAYPAPPDFTGSAFIRHFFYNAAGSVDKWQGDYTEEELQHAAEATYRQLLELKPFLWRKGATYPESPVRMNTLFLRMDSLTFLFPITRVKLRVTYSMVSFLILSEPMSLKRAPSVTLILSPSHIMPKIKKQRWLSQITSSLPKHNWKKQTPMCGGTFLF